jgi:epoxyqueuosine reductase
MDEKQDVPFMEMQRDFEKYLHKQGAVLVGFADLQDIPAAIFPTGISVAIPLPLDIIKGIQQYPTNEYYDTYVLYNQKLNQIVSAGAAYLKQYGFQAYANTTEHVKKDEFYCTKLPHKTVATRAGLGWIGKNCLLVTPEYGSAVRLSSLLTDAPFQCAVPITASRCGSCSRCVDACPAKALKGTLWRAGIERERILDIGRCISHCDRTVKEHIISAEPIKDRICGRCFAVCAMTQRYISVSTMAHKSEGKDGEDYKSPK